MYDNQLALPGLTQMTDKDTCCIVYSLVRNLYQQQDTKIKYFCLKAFEAQILCWVLIHQKSSEIALIILDLSGDSWFSSKNLNKQSFYLWVLFQYLAAAWKIWEVGTWMWFMLAFLSGWYSLASSVHCQLRCHHVTRYEQRRS